MSPNTLMLVVPEMVLVGVGTLLYMAGAWLPNRRVVLNALAIAGILGSATALACQYHWLFRLPDSTMPALVSIVEGPLAADLFGQFIRWLTLGAGLMFVLMSTRVHPGGPAAEYLGTLLMATAGVMLAASARDLVLLFLGLELVSIPTYVLLYLSRRDALAQESTMKYFFLSILSSAILLYGFSFLYGIGGSMQFAEIRAALLSATPGEGSLLLGRVALALVVAGLAFRIAAVPFHFYAADVYQGTTNGNAALLSVLPKIVGFAVLVRLLVVALPGLESFGWRLAMILSVLTMTLGNTLALWQNNLRRLLAYSSIAHAGYMLIGLATALAAGDDATMFAGVAAVLVYLCVYAVAVCGTFAAVIYLGRGDREINQVDELAGVGRTHPWVGAALAVFMFSLAGIPPLAGFWGKLLLFSSALDIGGNEIAGGYAKWFVGLAIVGALNAAIAAYYYLRIVAVAYFGAADDVPSTVRGSRGAALAMGLCALGVLAIGVYPLPIVEGAKVAGASIRTQLIPQDGSAVAASSPQAVDPAKDVDLPNKTAATSAVGAEVAAAP